MLDTSPGSKPGIRLVHLSVRPRQLHRPHPLRHHLRTPRVLLQLPGSPADHLSDGGAEHSLLLSPPEHVPVPDDPGDPQVPTEGPHVIQCNILETSTKYNINTFKLFC